MTKTKLVWTGVAATLCILFFVAGREIRSTREMVRRLHCRGHFAQLNLALDNYQVMNGSYFPPAYLLDAEGKPAHSWRVLLLPYIDQQELYNEYRFDEPWNGPHNSKLAERMPPIYRCPNYGHYLRQQGLEATQFSVMTNMVAIIAPNGIFSGPEACSVRQITDGPTKTLLFVETQNHLVHWMSPRDINEEEFLADLRAAAIPGPTHHHGGLHIRFADGPTKLCPPNLPQSILHAYVTRNGQEVLDEALDLVEHPDT